jgi:hypothetical protein
MWIVPKNFSGTYPFVQGIQELGLDSNEFCQLCERSLMSKSKPTQFKTWLTRWNKDSYLQHLCTQTLKPSHSQTFVDAWTSYLAAFPASPSVKPGQEDQQKTHGISSPTLPMESTPVQQDMFSSKTSKESSPPKPLTGKVFSDMSSENWKDCVTRRRGEYSVRQKQAQAIRESEYLSLLQEMESRSMTCSPDTQSQNPPSGQPDLTNNSLNGKSQESSNWPTPRAVDSEGGLVTRTEFDGKRFKSVRLSGQTFGSKLRDAVENLESWATPNTMDHLPSRSVESQMQRALGVRKGRSKPDNLREQVDPEQVAVYQEAKNWPTPTASEALKKGAQPQYGQICLSNHPIIVGPVTREKKIKSGNEKKWATPTTRDHKGSYSPKALVRKDGKSRMDLLPQQAQYDETNISKVGKLNPSWVEQLMGLPVQWSMLPEPISAHRVSRLMLLGNGVVPQQAEVAFRTLLAQADQDHQS